MRKENANPDFVAMEKATLKFWQDEQCFEKLVEKNKNGERFRFLDGPITANNPMGIHHSWGRTMKDMYIKYNAMLGKSCQYQNGFDYQGLWVEVETEKDLGIEVKSDITKYGVDKFTTKCMDRVKKSRALFFFSHGIIFVLKIIYCICADMSQMRKMLSSTNLSPLQEQGGARKRKTTI